jgi:hypothetical protein
MVVPAQEGVAPKDLYRNNANTPFHCAARILALAIMRTQPLASPDQAAVAAASWTGSVLAVDLEIRRYDGYLAANDPWIALVSLELGRLEPGPHEVAVRTTVLHFTDLLHPEAATDPASSEQRFRFECN